MGLSFLPGEGDLAVGDRHEAPVIAPGIVEDVQDDRRFLVELALVDLADADALVLLAGLDDALDEWRKVVRDVELIGVERLDRRIAAASIQGW